MKNIPIASPSVRRTDIASVVKVLKSGNLAQGPEVKKFEEELADYLNVKHVISLSSLFTEL